MGAGEPCPAGGKTGPVKLGFVPLKFPLFWDSGPPVGVPFQFADGSSSVEGNGVNAGPVLTPRLLNPVENSSLIKHCWHFMQGESTNSIPNIFCPVS